MHFTIFGKTGAMAFMSSEQVSTSSTLMAKRLVDRVQSFAWYIDFGASQHFTNMRDWFTEYKAWSDFVIFGGGEEYIVVGKGNI